MFQVKGTTTSFLARIVAFFETFRIPGKARLLRIRLLRQVFGLQHAPPVLTLYLKRTEEDENMDVNVTQ